MYYTLDEVKNKNIICVGNNKTCQETVEFINNSVETGTVQYIEYSDTSKDFEKLRSLDFTKYIIIKTEDVPGHLIPAPYTTPTRIFFLCARQIGSKIIGVTGTKGKSTTAGLLAHILREANMQYVLASDTGTPEFGSLSTATEQTIFVLELSSFQLVELEMSPDIAIITNLSRDHIDYHQTLERYWEAKRNIIRHMGPQGKVVYDPHTEVILHWLAESTAKKLPIDTEEMVDMSQSSLIGDHNKINYLQARTVAMELGVDKFTCQTALKSFDPLQHRLQKVRIVKDIIFVDDAIASQPEATIAGIKACIREVGPVGCVLLGGKDNEYNFVELVKLLSTLLIPKLVLFPETGDQIKGLFPQTYQPEILETSSMQEAVKWASEHVPSGSVCLLSSASPSFPVWKNFEEKGDLFQKAVQELSN